MSKLFYAATMAAVLSFSSDAYAYGDKPVDPKPVDPAPIYNVDNSTEVWNKPVNTNQQAQGQAQGQQQGQQQNATGVGIGHGGAGGQGGAGGAGGNADANATGGSAVSHGSQQQQQSTANARGGNQSQRATGGNVGDITVQNNNRQAASSAYAAPINGCGAAGGFSAGISTFGWGASAARCKADRFAQVVEAERLFRQGSPAAVAYLSAVDGPARRAFVNTGMVQDRSRQPQRTQSSSFAKVETSHSVSYNRCDMFNGSIYFGTKRGHNREVAKQQCVASLTAQPAQQAAQQPVCPEGSRWDGKGCWMSRK